MIRMTSSRRGRQRTGRPRPGLVCSLSALISAQGKVALVNSYIPAVLPAVVLVDIEAQSTSDPVQERLVTAGCQALEIGFSWFCLHIGFLPPEPVAATRRSPAGPGMYTSPLPVAVRAGGCETYDVYFLFRCSICANPSRAEFTWSGQLQYPGKGLQIAAVASLPP